MPNRHQNSELLLPHQLEALTKLLSATTPEVLLCHFRSFYDGFVYNANGNVEIEDHHCYRELSSFLETLRTAPVHQPC